jgi:hypothetical protein
MLRHVFMVVAKQQDELGALVVDYVIQCASVRDVITMSDLRRATKAASGVEKADRENDMRIRVVMDGLIADGWAQYAQDHPRHPSFAINPDLATAYADYRQQVIQAKQDVIDRIGQALSDQYNRPIVPTATAIGYVKNAA